MDYQRIYNQLPAGRRANPPDTDEYHEEHPIVPRCMVGGDEPENLIRLVPEDHYLAHLLLAKINERVLWVSVAYMSELRRTAGMH